ncbi:MAG: hypothetical protein AAFY76_03595 [Cyanobacteria bacterium J06649_11]
MSLVGNRRYRPTTFALSIEAADLSHYGIRPRIGEGVIYYHSHYRGNPDRVWNYLRRNQVPFADRAGALQRIDLSVLGIGAMSRLNR